MAKRIGVLLSDCGYPDGSETQKAVLTLFALDWAGAEPVCLAPDIEQAQVVNHLTGQTEPIERRNALVEAARIARGNASPLVFEEAAGLDGLMVPGGDGAVTPLAGGNPLPAPSWFLIPHAWGGLACPRASEFWMC